MSVNDPGTGPEDTQYVLDALERGLKDTSYLGSIETWLTREADWSGIDAAERFPIVEIIPIDEVPNTQSQTFVRYLEDSNGNQVGEIYELARRLRAQLSIHTLAGSDHSHTALGDNLRLALFKYSEEGYDDLLPDGSGGGIATIKVRPDSAGEQSSTAESGGTIRLYSWRQDVILPYTKRVSTYEEYGELPYVEDVYYPADGDYTDADADGDVAANYPY